MLIQGFLATPVGIASAALLSLLLFGWACWSEYRQSLQTGAPLAWPAVAALFVALLSTVLALRFSIFRTFVLNLTAIALGIFGLFRIRQRPGFLHGTGMAVTALVLAASQALLFFFALALLAR